MTKLFNTKGIIVYCKIESGFYYQVQFDSPNGHFTIENDSYYPNPIECREEAIEFCKVNGIEFTEDWSSL